MANAWMWAVAAGGVLGAAWVIVLWKAVGLLRSLAGLEDRVARLTDALALLADTTETGFRSLTEQMVPVAAASAPGPRRAEQAIRTTTGRVVRASNVSATMEIGMIHTGTASTDCFMSLRPSVSSVCRRSACRVDIKRFVVSSQPISAWRIELLP